MMNLAMSNLSVILIGLLFISCILCFAKVIVIVRYGPLVWRRQK